MREFVVALRTAFPDIHFTVEDMLTEGDKLTCRYRFTGTHKAELWGLAPTGRTFTVAGTSMHRFAGGRIVEVWSNWDVMGFFKQLGLLTDPVVAEANKALVRRFIEEIINQGNLALADEIIASEFRHLAPHTPELRGPDGLKQFATAIRTAFPDNHCRIDELTAEADRVVCRWTATGTHRGDWMGISPTGKRGTCTGSTRFRIASGKILEQFIEWDLLGLGQQLGAVPPLGQAAATAAR